MARLYKFECDPNHPVVSRAVLVFFVPDSSVQEVMSLAIKLAELDGFYYPAGEGSELTYLGEYMPTRRQMADGTNILVSISGEY